MFIFNVICKRMNRVFVHQYISLRFKHKMKNEVYFRHVGNSDRFEVTFKISNKNVDRQFNLKRLLSENIEDFVARIKTNVEKVIIPKAKRRKINVEDPLPSVNVELIQNGNIVDGSKQCKELIFEDGKDLFFSLLGENYKVIVNPPWVDSLSLPQSLMVGSYCYPSKLEIIFGDPENSIFEWYKRDRNSTDWIELDCSTKLLLVSEEYLNCNLKLRCIPSDGKINGPDVEVITNAVIKEGPGKCPFLKRHMFTSQLLPDERVVSYNILAEVYAETVTAKQELFPYCPPFALNIDYRKQLYIKEILGYNADIICLQEVDVRIFKNDLCPVLEEIGYQGVLTRKGGTVAEGIATFFAKRKFRLLKRDASVSAVDRLALTMHVLIRAIARNKWTKKETNSERIHLKSRPHNVGQQAICIRLIDLKELSFGEALGIDPIFDSIWNPIKNNEPVINNFKERTTVFHALVLESGDNTVVVGNTHLFFYPSADHIRLLQGGMASLYLEHIVKNLEKLGKKTTLLFCGDMNSTPDCGLYSLMTNKVAPADLPDWHSDKTEVVQGFEMTQPFEMKSAYGEPKFTNYTVGFSGCLDYIYYQSDVLKLIQAVPIPSEDEVKAHTALPSPLFPSDHVALVADFEWIKT